MSATSGHAMSKHTPHHTNIKISFIGQTHGDLDACLEVWSGDHELWSGDHRQTPGGLKKSKESKAFRKKLTKRPLALRCQTQ